MTNQINSYQALVERIHRDEDLKHRFITNPKAILVEVGAKVPDSVKVEVHEDGLNLRNYILPRKDLFEGSKLEGDNSTITQVIQQALADDAFKALLLQNPKAALKQATGEDVPDAVNIRFYEDTPTVKHLVIPVNAANQELSESELDMVAGGIGSSILPRFPFIAGMITTKGLFT
jgi:hypothetical protein